MNTTFEDVLKFIEDEDVKFIRMAFRDAYGVQKNISVMPGELKKAFEDGIPIEALMREATRILSMLSLSMPVSTASRISSNFPSRTMRWEHSCLIPRRKRRRLPVPAHS